MTTIWFLVALTMNPDGTWWMRDMPIVKDSFEHCMAQDYLQNEVDKMVCVEADDFADLIKILLTKLNFGGQPA